MITDTSKRKWITLQSEFFEISKPFVQMACDVLAVSTPMFLIDKDGKVQTIHTPETREVLQRIEDLRHDAISLFLARNENALCEVIRASEGTQ